MWAVIFSLPAFLLLICVAVAAAWELREDGAWMAEAERRDARNAGLLASTLVVLMAFGWALELLS